jgi:hypothetical protein
LPSSEVGADVGEEDLRHDRYRGDLDPSGVLVGAPVGLDVREQALGFGLGVPAIPTRLPAKVALLAGDRVFAGVDAMPRSLS